MAYEAPSLDELLNGVEDIEQRYQNPNQDRKRLIDLLKASRDYIREEVKKLKHANPPLSKDKLQAELDYLHRTLQGAYVFCLASIGSEYEKWWLDPVYKTNFLGYSYGSTLYSIVQQVMRITNQNKPGPTDKLNRMALFYSLVHNNEELGKLFAQSPVNKHLPPKNKLTTDIVENQAKEFLQAYFEKVCPDVKNLLRGVPTEEAIDSRAPNLAQEYVDVKTKAREPADRLPEAQLVQAIIELIKKDDDQRDKSFLSRSHKAKLGALLYYMHSIANEKKYMLLSPEFQEGWLFNSGSKLYSLFKDVINRLPDKVKADCLATFESFVTSYETKGAIERYGYQHFGQNNKLNSVDLKMRDTHENITKIIESYQASSYIIPAMKGMGALTAAALISPAYGIGIVLAEGIGSIDSFVGTKAYLGQYTSQIMINTCGEGGRIGYKVTDMAFNYSLEFLVASLLQMTAVAVGGVMGAGLAGVVIGLPVLGYHAMVGLCHLLRDLKDNLDPTFTQHISKELLETLMALPPEYFHGGEKDKARIKYLTTGRLAGNASMFSQHPVPGKVPPAITHEPAPEDQQRLVASHS